MIIRTDIKLHYKTLKEEDSYRGDFIYLRSPAEIEDGYRDGRYLSVSHLGEVELSEKYEIESLEKIPYDKDISIHPSFII